MRDIEVPSSFDFLSRDFLNLQRRETDDQHTRLQYQNSIIAQMATNDLRFPFGGPQIHIALLVLQAPFSESEL